MSMCVSPACLADCLASQFPVSYCPDFVAHCNMIQFKSDNNISGPGTSLWGMVHHALGKTYYMDRAYNISSLYVYKLLSWIYFGYCTWWTTFMMWTSSNYKFDDYFAKQMNLQGLFPAQMWLSTSKGTSCIRRSKLTFCYSLNGCSFSSILVHKFLNLGIEFLRYGNIHWGYQNRLVKSWFWEKVS